MSVWDNKRLADMAARSQVLIEGVKAGGINSLNAIIREMFAEMSGVMSRTKYSDLSILTKSELQLLLHALNDVKVRAYSRYVEYAMEWLRDFVDAHAQSQRQTWAYARFMIDREKAGLPIEGDDKPEVFTDEKASQFLIAFIPPFKRAHTAALATDNNRLWQSVTNTPVPATGLYPLPSFQAIVETAGAKVANEVRKAWTTPGTSGADVADSITEETKQGGSGIQATTLVYTATVLATVTQHAAQVVAEIVAATVFGEYRWYSIMDRRTSDICRSRNRKTYIMGRGPLPPAHPRCRSHVAPITDKAGTHEESMYTWLRQQPRPLLAYLFNESVADQIIAGTIGPADLPDLTFRPMSFRDYLAHTGTITT